ncbi:hypothetical protein SAY87_015600 [Trapa incisa]|uniref:E3 SUMO-protein ligase SIZ1 n=1 Tax=Trapa incisa TaxID=236973 RepID=A0AAN7QTS3_9MYRT|nr:hypothetical protein SAY87_015600 [Trapa incisa]
MLLSPFLVEKEEMDLVASCKEKLTQFRIRELKDVLTQLGLSKQGKKQDLIDRVLSLLSEEQVSKMWHKKNITKEEVARLVDDIYRKMQVSGATDLASKGHSSADCSNVKIKGEYDDPFRFDTKVRCPCGSCLETDSMIRCEEPSCHVWQHMNCVLIPENPMEDNHVPVPEVFYCELCRLSRADPFWVSMANPLYPVKLSVTTIPNDLKSPMQSVERTFQLTRVDRDLVSKPEYDVQVWCMLLNDKVSFRMQWPQYADLQVNGMPVRAINRPGSQLLGANGRDDGPIITLCTKDGINKISLSGCDTRIFCMGVRIVKRRTVKQILNLIPKESEGERFEDSLARVCRCVGGGGAAEADSDSDIEVVADSIAVNLRCPMSGSRMKVAGRFKPCAHMGCFDLEVFVEMNQRSRKWQCPICLKNYSLENVIIDPYFNRITSMMRLCGEDVTEIDVKPDGSWRVKTKSESERVEVGDLSHWHLPDGALCAPLNEKVLPKVELVKQVKQEGGSDGPTKIKLGMRKNQNGLWEFSKANTMNNCYGNKLHDTFEDDEQNIIPMSSSATPSGKDGEDTSVNQDGGGNFDFTANNGIELDSVAFNVDTVFGFAEQNPAMAVGNAEVIILSDSDEENDMLISSGSGYKGNQSDPSRINLPLDHTVMTDSFEDPVLGNGGNSCLGLFNSNDDDFGGMPLWTLPPASQAGPSFQLFTSDGNVSDGMVDLQHDSINCTTTMNGYPFASGTDMGSPAIVRDLPVNHSDNQLNENLVDNPLVLDRDDPSLQIFLPTVPSGASVQPNMRNQADMSNGTHTEDWISLSLGGGAIGGHGNNVEANGFSSRQQVTSGVNSLDSLADTASLLLGMNDDRSDKVSRQRSSSHFSHPRQKRSVRPRLYLSIDTDSE